MVHVDEAEKRRRFEDYFMRQIAQNGEIMRDVEAVLSEFWFTTEVVGVVRCGCDCFVREREED